MENNQLNSPYSLHNRQGEDTTTLTQKENIFRYLQEYTATNSMISYATGIPKRSICKYKRNLEKSGLLWEIEKTYCKITGFKAWYLTTDPGKDPNHSTPINII